MCRVALNPELNGIELAFESKPEKATLDAIKANGFRWNGKKKVWYAKQTADRLTFAETLGEVKEEKPAGINLDNLGSDKVERYEYAQAIRAAFKARGVKGCTVRQKWSGYTPDVTVTIKVTADDMSSVEEASQRYTENDFIHDIGRDGGLWFGQQRITLDDYNNMTPEEREKIRREYLIYTIKKADSFNGRYTWSNRKHYFEFSSKLYDKLTAVWAIANQWNYDNSDSMTDYFDVGYYLDIDIKHADFEPRETMTDEERAAFAAEKKREEEERQRAIKEEEERQRENERIWAEREKADKAAEELIYNSIIIEDLEEEEQIYISNCAGGAGKENSLKELEESTHYYNIDCVIDRKVIFTEAAYNEYITRFLYDYIFLYGKGGTGSMDKRLDMVENTYSLTTAQRESVKWFQCHCVGIYVGDDLKLVVDPQGHNYSRYVYLPTEDSETKNAALVLSEQEEESLYKPAFHFPKKVEEQATVLHEGMEVTIYQCDGWMLNSIYAGSGIVTGFYMGKWAQYDGLYIELLTGRKSKKVFIRDNKDCLIYEGIKGKLPEDITCRRVSENMTELYNYDVLLPNIYNYYLNQGIEPIIDTCYR